MLGLSYIANLAFKLNHNKRNLPEVLVPGFIFHRVEYQTPTVFEHGVWFQLKHDTLKRVMAVWTESWGGLPFITT